MVDWLVGSRCPFGGPQSGSLPAALLACGLGAFRAFCEVGFAGGGAETLVVPSVLEKVYVANCATCVVRTFADLPFISLSRSFFCAHFFSRPDEEKSAIKKHESKFVTMDPQAMYTIDRINNGLYR